MAVGGLIVCVLTSIHGGLLCRVTERHVYCSPRRDYSFGKSLELWPMVALLLSTLLGRPGIYIYTRWKERANGKMVRNRWWWLRFADCNWKIRDLYCKRACERIGKGGIRVLYVRETSDIKEDRLITCSRYSGLKGV